MLSTLRRSALNDEGLCCCNTSPLGGGFDEAVTNGPGGVGRLSVRFALSPRDVRIQVLVGTLDDPEVPFAETWRLVGKAAEELGFTRPGYHVVRVLARAERLRRRARTEVRQAALGVLGAFASPLMMDVKRAAERLAEAWAREGLVLEQHKPSSARPHHLRDVGGARAREGERLARMRVTERAGGRRGECAAGRGGRRLVPLRRPGRCRARRVCAAVARGALQRRRGWGSGRGARPHARPPQLPPCARGDRARGGCGRAAAARRGRRSCSARVTAVPGVVDQGDLDARWINACRPRESASRSRYGRGCAPRRARPDPARARRPAPLAARRRAARPRAALAGGRPRLTLPRRLLHGRGVPETRDPGLAAVHLGFHHGLGRRRARAHSAGALAIPPARACSPRTSR